MNEIQLAKIQNTINEIQNQLKKMYVDTPVFRLLMQRSINQTHELMTHIGYLEAKLETTVSIDEEWNIHFSHGPQANYLVQGETIQMLVDHIKYMHILIENCPGKKDEPLR
jgi:hypothetical protein